MTNREDRFNNTRFKDVLARFEAGRDNPDAMFFDVDDIIDIAEYYNDKADTDNSRKAVALAARLYPHSSMVLILQARMALFCDSDIEKARHYASLAAAEGAEDLEYYYLQAEMMLYEDNIDGADQYLESKAKLLEGDDLADFYIDVPFIFLDYRLPELAQKWLARSSEKDDPNYLEAEGRIAFQTDHYDESEAIFKKLLEDEPFSTQLWNTLASAQYLNGHVVESIDSSGYAIAINPNDAEALLNKARCLSTLYRFGTATGFYERYLKIYPNDAAVRLLYAVALTACTKYDKAIANLYMAKELCDNKTIMPDIIKHLAYVLPKKGRTEEALRLIDNAEKDGTLDHTNRMLAEGRLCLDTNNMKGASDCYLDAIISSRHDMGVYLDIANAYYEKDKIDESVQTLLAGLSFNPQEKRGYAYLADCYRQKGMVKEYLDTLKLACKYNPLETKEVLGEFFPIDMDPRDFYKHAAEILDNKQQ